VGCLRGESELLLLELFLQDAPAKRQRILPLIDKRNWGISFVCNFYFELQTGFFGSGCLPRGNISTGNR